jgi:hypothetical protein
MLFNTTRKFPYVADVYFYKQQTSFDGRVVTNVYDVVPTKIRLSMTSDLALGGATTVTGTDLGSVFIYTRTKLQIDAKLANILDSQGTVMYEGGGEWKVTMSAPYLGPMGIQDGYKYRLSQTKGNI